MATLITNEEAPVWVEMLPSGIAVATELGRPVLILKDKADEHVLPVWMHPLDAGVALAEMSEGSGLTPHSVTKKLLAQLNLAVESCTFVDLIGHHQYVQLNFKATREGAPEVEAMRMRADEAMSFCLQNKAKFLATPSYMARCRRLNAELGQLEQNLATGAMPALQASLETSSKKQPYMM
jgi:bifunctional DNase/RNase